METKGVESAVVGLYCGWFLLVVGSCPWLDFLRGWFACVVCFVRCGWFCRCLVVVGFLSWLVFCRGWFPAVVDEYWCVVALSR